MTIEENSLEGQRLNIPPVTSPKGHQEAVGYYTSDIPDGQNKIIFSPTSPTEDDVLSPTNPYFNSNEYYAENMMRSGIYAPGDQQQGPISPPRLNQHQNKNQYCNVRSPSMFTGHSNESMDRNQLNMGPRNINCYDSPNRNHYQTGNIKTGSDNPQFQTGSNSGLADPRSPKLIDAQPASRYQFNPGYTSPDRGTQINETANHPTSRNQFQSNNPRSPSNNTPIGRSPPMNDSNFTRHQLISRDQFQARQGDCNMIQDTPMKNQQNARYLHSHEFSERNQYQNYTRSSIVPPTLDRKQHQNESKLATDHKNSFGEDRKNDTTETDSSTYINYDVEDHEKSFDKERLMLISNCIVVKFLTEVN